MNRLGLTSSLRKSTYSSEPRRTLSFVNVESDQEHSTSESSTRADKHKSKTEKSVHFADEDSIADDASSLINDPSPSEGSEDGITWIPSEHLYSDDTFIQDTETTAKDHESYDPTTTIATVPSYGSSTFIPLGLDEEEEDNTDTEQLYSYTDSFVSSDMFTTHSGTTTYKSWRDVTEIVKDIEELEESEFVTRVDSLEFDQKEGDDTEASESLDEELAEEARREFVTFALRQLQSNELQSPRSLAVDSFMSGQSSVEEAQTKSSAPRSKEERKFCLKMIQKCQKNAGGKGVTQKGTHPSHPLYKEAARRKEPHQLEYYGLNSALMERLRLENLQVAMDRKSQALDRDISSSESFVKTTAEDESVARDQFVSEICARVRRENMDDAIQAHLIKMHPVTKFAEFVKGLPKADENVREILYEYKKQLEHRMTDEVT